MRKLFLAILIVAPQAAICDQGHFEGESESGHVFMLSRDGAEWLGGYTVKPMYVETLKVEKSASGKRRLTKHKFLPSNCIIVSDGFKAHEIRCDHSHNNPLSGTVYRDSSKGTDPTKNNLQCIEGCSVEAPKVIKYVEEYDPA